MRKNRLDAEGKTLSSAKAFKNAHNKYLQHNVEELEKLLNGGDFEQLNDWEQESIKIALSIAQDREKEELDGAIREILKLAGLTYEIEKSNFRKRQDAKRRYGK